MDGRHVVLVGPMGSGKSAVGRALADRLGNPHADLDTEIELAAGATIPEIFRADGERRFRELESAALARLLDGDPSVISTGGGVVLAPTNRARLRDGRATVVWLDAEIDVLATRVGDGTGRPLLGADVRADLADTVRTRRQLYDDVADLRVDTSSPTVPEVAEQIAAALEHGVPG